MATIKQRGATVEAKCKSCKQPFMARVADRKRGWGKYCSKSCKAKKQASSMTREQRRQYRLNVFGSGDSGRSHQFANAHLFSNEE